MTAKNFHACCDSPLRQRHIRGCKYHQPNDSDRLEDVYWHNCETIPGFALSNRREVNNTVTFQQGAR